MYERFTDRARKVMQLANQEAQRFNRKYIGTEHILLGLVADASGETFPRPSDAHLSDCQSLCCSAIRLFSK